MALQFRIGEVITSITNSTNFIMYAPMLLVALTVCSMILSPYEVALLVTTMVATVCEATGFILDGNEKVSEAEMGFICLSYHSK